MRAIGFAKSFTAEPITLARDPSGGPFLNQVWDLSPSVRPDQQHITITYKINNGSTQSFLQDDAWRFLFMPPPTPDPTPQIPHPTPQSPSVFLLYKDFARTCLGLDSAHQFVSVNVGGIKPGDRLDNVAPPWNNFAALHMVEHPTEFRTQYSHLLWKLMPETWDQPDGKIMLARLTV